LLNLLSHGTKGDPELLSLPGVLYFTIRDALESKPRLFSGWLMVFYVYLPLDKEKGQSG